MEPTEQAPESSVELSFGQKAVGISFNPGGKPEVNKIKELSAALIDELNYQHTSAWGNGSAVNSEIQAQYSLAIRSIQVGQMWGVKAATWQY